MVLRFMMAALLALCYQNGSEPESKHREIRVRVIVRSSANAPVPDMAVICESSDPHSGTTGLTGQDGTCALSISMPDRDGAVFLRFPAFPYIQSTEQRCKSVEQYIAATSLSHFDRWYRVPVANSNEQVTIEIVGKPAIRVTGHSPRLPEPRQRLSARSHSTAEPADKDRGPDFVLRGVERDKPALIVVSNGVQPEVRVFQLTASETKSDVDLGEANLPATKGAANCEVRIADRESVVHRPQTVSPSVTLIAEDRSHVFTFCIAGDGSVVTPGFQAPLLPPGTYAVVPGTIGDDPGPAAVYAQMDRGKTVPGIPTITVTESGTNRFELTLRSAGELVASLPAYPSEATK